MLQEAQVLFVNNDGSVSVHLLDMVTHCPQSLIQSVTAPEDSPDPWDASDSSDSEDSLPEDSLSDSDEDDSLPLEDTGEGGGGPDGEDPISLPDEGCPDCSEASEDLLASLAPEDTPLA